MMTLRELRQDRLISIEDLAKLAGVSTKTIVDIEHGRVTPKFRTVRRITEALGVSHRDVTEFVRRNPEGDVPS